MTKLHSAGLALLFAMASLLAGCQLYFGSSDSSSGPGGDRPPGSACSSDKQCAAGCFCGTDGTCAEGGFCGNDKDCGSGFHCDAARSSCIPNPVCSDAKPCSSGSICESGGCIATCTCANDADAVRAGFGWCDLARNTCMRGTNPEGACTGAVTCTTFPPICPEGQVPGRGNGCFTGTCRAISACEAAPECKALIHEADCRARTTDCRQITVGQDCHHPDGSDCNAGDTDCVCRVNTFHDCADRQ